MYRKAMWMGLLGYAAGCLIGLVFTLSAGAANFREALAQILLGGIPGALAMGSSVVYGIEKWSILRATATHFIITMGALLFGGYVLQWFGSDRTPLLIMMAISLVCYAVIWLVFYLSYRKTIQQMNDDLRKMKSDRQGE